MILALSSLLHVGEPNSNFVSLCGWGVPFIADNGELRIPGLMAHSGCDEYTSSYSRDLYADQNTVLEVHSILDLQLSDFISLNSVMRSY